MYAIYVYSMYLCRNIMYITLFFFTSCWKIKIQPIYTRIAGNETVDIFSDISTDEMPERELYIRWLELATFLPVIRYSHLPSQYDKEVIDLAKNLTALRQQKVKTIYSICINTIVKLLPPALKITGARRAQFAFVIQPPPLPPKNSPESFVFRQLKVPLFREILVKCIAPLHVQSAITSECTYTKVQLVIRSS